MPHRTPRAPRPTPQVAVALTAVNVLYKLVVVAVGARLQMLLGTFEAAADESDERSRDLVGTSTGREYGSGSLAAQDAMTLKVN